MIFVWVRFNVLVLVKLILSFSFGLFFWLFGCIFDNIGFCVVIFKNMFWVLSSLLCFKLIWFCRYKVKLFVVLSLIIVGGGKVNINVFLMVEKYFMVLLVIVFIDKLGCWCLF